MAAIVKEVCLTSETEAECLSVGVQEAFQNAWDSILRWWSWSSVSWPRQGRRRADVQIRTYPKASHGLEAYATK
jgi:hypothetical protein